MNRRRLLQAAVPVAIAAHGALGRCLASAYRSGEAASLYTRQTRNAAELSWDLCTDRLHVMLGGNGQPHCAATASAVQALPFEQQKGGVYSTKQVHYRAMQVWQLLVDGKDFPLATPDSVNLLESVIPQFHWSRSGLAVSAVYWMLQQSGRPDMLAITLQVASSRGAAVAIAWRVTDPAEPIPFQNAPPLQMDLQPAASVVQPGGVIELNAVWQAPEGSNAPLPASSPVPRWSSSLETFAAPYRGLCIPDDPAAESSYARMGELARGSLLAADNGTVVGGFLGSDFDARTINWTRDSYYAALSTSVTHPSLCRRVIPFLLNWGMPQRCSTRGLLRFPGVQPVTQSLSNSVPALPWRGPTCAPPGTQSGSYKGRLCWDRCKASWMPFYRAARNRSRCSSPPCFFQTGKPAKISVPAPTLPPGLLFPALLSWHSTVMCGQSLPGTGRAWPTRFAPVWRATVPPPACLPIF